VNPNLTDLDPYWGTASAVDEMIRNLAAVGARLDSIADNLNLPNPKKAAQMGKIHLAAAGMGDAARALHVPFISGNVSMYNESPVTPIPVTPTLLGAGIVNDVRKCVTADLKRDGARLYLAGAPTTADMGGSEYYALAGGKSNQVPRVDWSFTKKAAEAVVSAIEKGLVWSCHDVSAGGLAVAVAEMGIGGDLGATIYLDRMGDLPTDVKLFSESNTRWVIEAKSASELESHFAMAGVPLVPLGVTAGEPGTKEFRFIEAGKDVARFGIADARKAFTEALPKLVGGQPVSEKTAAKKAAPKKKIAAKKRGR
jgi:phosphoribosylformylglycinamidine synthase